jgi:hypothetical protein
MRVVASGMVTRWLGLGRVFSVERELSGAGAEEGVIANVRIGGGGCGGIERLL